MNREKIIEILKNNSQKFLLGMLENPVNCIPDWNYDIIANKIMLEIEQKNKKLPRIRDLYPRENHIGSNGLNDKIESER